MDRSGEIYKKTEDIVTRSIAGETILVPVRAHVADLNAVYTLNEVGSRAWQLIDGKTSLSSIVQTLVMEYEVESGTVEQDIGELIDSLHEAGLIAAAA